MQNLGPFMIVILKILSNSQETSIFNHIKSQRNIFKELIYHLNNLPIKGFINQNSNIEEQINKWGKMIPNMNLIKMTTLMKFNLCQKRIRNPLKA